MTSARHFATCFIRNMVLLLAVTVACCLKLSNVTAEEGTEGSFFIPLNWGGNVSYQVLTNKTGDELRTFRNVVSTDLFVDSFIWQPWFITVGTALNLAEMSTSGNDESTTSILAGRINFNILPLSRFPLTLNYAHNDNRIQFDSDTNTTTSDAFDVLSRVRLSDTLNLQTGVNYDISSQSDGGGQESSKIRINVEKRFDDHFINATLSDRRREQEDAGTNGTVSAQSDALSIRHNYTPWKNVTYDNTSNFLIDSSDSTSEDLNETLFQTTSTLRWAPDDKPYTVTGIWRSLTRDEENTFSSSSSTAGTTESQEQSLSGQTGLSYRFSPRLTGDVSIFGSFASNEIKTTSAVSTSPSQPSTVTYGGDSGIDYFSEPKPLFNFDWQWGAGGGLSFNGGSMEKGTYAENAGANHTVSRMLDFPLLAPIRFSASQGTRFKHSSIEGISPNLSHNLRLAQNFRKGNQWTLISFNGADNRILAGKTRTARQLANIQVTSGLEQNVDTSWNANLTIQSSRQAGSDSNDNGWDTTAQGAINLTKRNVFGVGNLNFSSDLGFESTGLVPISFSAVDDNAKSDQTWRRQWTNRLTYQIGQTALELQARLTQRETNKLEDLFIFRITRTF